MPTIIIETLFVRLRPIHLASELALLRDCPNANQTPSSLHFPSPYVPSLFNRPLTYLESSSLFHFQPDYAAISIYCILHLHIKVAYTGLTKIDVYICDSILLQQFKPQLDKHPLYRRAHTPKGGYTTPWGVMWMSVYTAYEAGVRRRHEKLLELLCQLLVGGRQPVHKVNTICTQVRKYSKTNGRRD